MAAFRRGIDETLDAPLPTACLRFAGGRLRETHIAGEYQAGISGRVVYRRINIHVGVCQKCRQAAGSPYPALVLVDRTFRLAWRSYRLTRDALSEQILSM
ncbi:MAG: hypothetical protein DCC67_05040 [Planctomycetota bacterium]|nr:MAG: hypothetical protein DCC67_05040 [Planctomycetota bacterium]